MYTFTITTIVYTLFLLLNFCVFYIKSKTVELNVFT